MSDLTPDSKRFSVEVNFEGEFTREERAKVLADLSAAYRLDNGSVEVGYNKQGFRLRGNYSPSDNLEVNAEASASKRDKQIKAGVKYWW
jgi:hypothetical protein